MKQGILAWARRLLAPPAFADEDKTRTARLLYGLLLALLLATTLFTTALSVFYGMPREFSQGFTQVSGVVSALVFVGLLAMVRNGRVRVAGIILIALFWTMMTSWIVGNAGIATDTSTLVYPLIIALAGLLLGGNGAVVVGMLSIGAIVAAFITESSGIIRVTHDPVGLVDLAIAVLIVCLMTVLLRHGMRLIAEGFSRARANEHRLRESNRLLEAARASLEQRAGQLQAAVRKYVDHMAEVARGNLAVRLELGADQDDDPLVVLGQSLNATTASLQQMTARVRYAADDLSQAAAEILAATNQQTVGASDQSAAISRTAGTIEEVRALAEQTAERAQGVADLAQDTIRVAEAGRQTMADMIVGMRKVKEEVEAIAGEIAALWERAQRISQIIYTAGEIAAQSDILALNAAVEAARAGAAGKGFAVVAGEMRHLAEQSRKATDQVREILSQVREGVEAVAKATEAGVKGTDAGVKLAGKGEATIQQLAESVIASAQAAAQITTAANQQVEGMEQITQAMAEIHQVTAQNVAGAQHVEGAAAELHRLAGQLREVVAQYRV